MSENGWKVLIIDDEEGIRRSIVRALDREFYEVFTAGDGNTGIDILKKHVSRISTVISDFRMPGIDGLQALAETPESVGVIPVLFITGMANPPDLAQAGAVGACRVIRKPFQFAELLAEVERFIRR